jgi:hypothetical protein
VNERTNEHAVTSGILILAYAQFVIMLIELQKVLSDKLKCPYSRSTTVLSESTIPKTMEVSHIFIVLETKSTGLYAH